MTFKTILAVTEADGSDDDLHLAAALCEEAGAHLSTLVVGIAAPPPVGEYAAVVSDIWVKERRDDIARLTSRTSGVSAFLAALPVSADVTSEYAEQFWADDAVGRRARYADLVLVGPGLAASPLLRDKVVEGVLFASGRPLLVVPDNARATLRPERVSVAWDGGMEASRAVREAIDLLTAAREVRLVLIDPVGGEEAHGAEPGADLASYLSRHGAKVTVDRLPSEGHPVAAILARHARDTACELLVAGAYGHSRLRESLLGGVTRSLLENPPLPVLLAR
ncbi:universal stress protein [Nitratireductor mangrovi]|uniref:Universal stress protein n=1 Tax=Nitratireductor mangrovi TaxID=2599600 RepID=A0A5B8L0A1_9HYPH|nr:universal stress protein [Nitratireductor mangrovi]QDZ01355.1 universal stress protein [Nitratireductor mangrovi]